ncbi:MAG: sigma-54-dependent Fis family transcriptional regulator [Labilithrix sp.]|nr:sigma-54-dependent Fis family transcriptional regulator [Labilithrix sp.]MCW5818106.1 sigma-54-dependent Fis family transcriptional regulator [Labilithrix sp.]
MTDDTKTGTAGPGRSEPSEADAAGTALLLAWSLAEPSRLGEVAFAEGRGPWVLGRGAARDDDPGPRLLFAPHRPGAARKEPAPLLCPALSRRQLVMTRAAGGITIERTGKLSLEVNGRKLDRATIAPGDVLLLEGQMALLCIERARGAFMRGSEPAFAFGEADGFGIVGESVTTWTMRDTIDFYGRRESHVLVTGPSGAGKELAARAIHALSPRRAGPFVARNAATLPDGIVDAELFGNAKNYPNAGMRERAGLVGEADGGTLFLDEIGELPSYVQAHLLRLLDAGEYHRLGEDRARRCDLRLVAATNRDEDALKHDLLARLKLRLEIPGIDERVEDVPLLARAILQEVSRRDAQLRERFFTDDAPRVEPALIAALLRHSYTGHVRELESLLLLSMAESRHDRLTLSAGVSRRLRLKRIADAPPSRDEIARALDDADGNVSHAWKALGLSSRDALNRLLKKHGMTRREPAGDATSPRSRRGRT